MLDVYSVLESILLSQYLFIYKAVLKLHFEIKSHCYQEKNQLGTLKINVQQCYNSKKGVGFASVHIVLFGTIEHVLLHNKFLNGC